MSHRILIVDDVAHLRDVLRLTLEFKGYAVTTAADGQEAMRAAEQEKFDLIFCDIEMPVMNGLDFVRRYREKIDGQTPIVMLTAEGSELIAKARALGATDVVVKPFEPIQVLQKMEQWL